MTRSEAVLVLVAGWPGSGKSTLAAALAPRLGQASSRNWTRSAGTDVDSAVTPFV